MRICLAITIGLIVAGCSSEPKVAPPPSANAQARKEFADKMKAIPPSERAKYFREHSSEAMGAFGMGGRPK